MQTVTALLFLAVAIQTPGVPPLDGTWGGWARQGDDYDWIQVRIEGGSLAVNAPNAGLHRAPARSFRSDGAEVRFEFDGPDGTVEVVGAVDGRTLMGEQFVDGEALGALELTRFHDVRPGALDRHLGRYETEEGAVLWVIPRTYGGVRLVSHAGAGVRYGDWEFDAWLPLSGDTYFPPVFGEPALPPARTLEFEDDALHVVGEGALSAERTDGDVRRVTFESDGLRLEGWLMVPPGAGPHPAVAFAHGSGYVSADHPFDLYTTARLVRDVDLAVLRWDKRGVGGSGGDQAVASYHDLADDVLAAVTWLLGQPDLDPDRIGIGGISQAPSAPLPIAASRSKDVAFVIATSGFVGTPIDTNLFNWSNRMRARGMSAEVIAEVVAFFRGLAPYMLDPSPEGQAAYDRYLDEHRGASWFEYASGLALLETPLAHPAIERWRRIHDVDSADYWRRVECPVYQAWGADDHLVDAALAASRMAAIAAETGRDNITSVVYPSPAGHGVGSANTPTYFQDLARWFRAAVLGAGGGASK